MEIEKIIKSKLEILPKNDIIKKLDYTSNKKGLKAFEKFINSKNLHSWLSSGFYDFKYDALSFFQKLCEIINIDKELVNQAISEDKKYCKELEKFKYSYIFVNTNFKRKGEQILALAFLESRRRLKIPVESLLFKSEDEILNIASDFISNHYKDTKGDIGIWGKTVNYVFHHNGNEYKFDTEGNRIDDDIDIVENIATLRLK